MASASNVCALISIVLPESAFHDAAGQNTGSRGKNCLFVRYHFWGPGKTGSRRHNLRRTAETTLTMLESADVSERSRDQMTWVNRPCAPIRLHRAHPETPYAIRGPKA